MSERCPECGARLRQGTACRDNFHDMLALEWQVPGGAGELAHFYAVSAYILQHPDSMSYTVESLAWLRTAVADSLAHGARVEDLRAGARREGRAAGRVTRRAGDSVRRRCVSGWSMTVADVLEAGVDDYCEHVRSWAASVIEDLAASGPAGAASGADDAPI